jgi:multisubunit Na+/H+ antiporter MnhB subunit
VKAIATRSAGWILGAAAVAVLGHFIRGELSLLPVVLVLAAGLFAWIGPWGKRQWASWSWWDRAGAGVLFLGALIVVNGELSHASRGWEIPTRLYKGRIFDLGLQAGTIFTIGIGILPVVAGLAVAFSFREAATVERRAFLAVLWATLVAFATYTAVKSAYISTNFATRVEERNLFYVAPVLFAATAVWLDRPRLRWGPALGSVAFVGFLLGWKQYQLLYPYFEAPGNGILALANREFEWSDARERTIMLWILAFCTVVVLLPAALTTLRRTVSETWVWAGRGMLWALAAVVVVWSLTGEIYSQRGFRQGADDFARNLPKPLDWVDRAAKRDDTVYVGQYLPSTPDGVWLTEFWNRSIRLVWSLDGTAPGPGPTQTPDLVSRDGTHEPAPGTEYALADNGVELAAPLVARRRGLKLYRIGGTLRVAETVENVASDGWIGAEGGWSKFATPGNGPGTAVVALSRLGFCGDAPVGRVTVRLGSLVIGEDKHPAIGQLRGTRHVLLPNCRQRVLRLPSGPPPFQVQVSVTPTFRLSDYGISDSRVVGAVVGFAFVPKDAAQISAKR